MKLLLCKNIEKLGIVGDVVEVAPGYGRNYLVPQGLATEPTQTNMRALAEARRVAEEERAKQIAELRALAERIEGVEVTIKARANEDGALYGSVGAREIAAALAEEEFYIKPEQVDLPHPIRHIDTVSVDLKLADGLRSSIKVWIVREKVDEDGDETSDDTSESLAGREAGDDDHSADQ